MLLPLTYQYCGQYDHLVRIDIDRQGVMKKYLGSYQSQAPVNRQLSTSQIQQLEQQLLAIDAQSNNETAVSQSGFRAVLRFGASDDRQQLAWHGPALEQSPSVSRLVQYLVSL